MELDAILIGGGAAGLAAARELARAGLRFILLDDVEYRLVRSGFWHNHGDVTAN